MSIDYGLEIARNTATPGDTLRRFFAGAKQYGHDHILAATLRNPSLPGDVLKTALSEGHADAWANPGLALLILSCEVNESELWVWCLKPAQLPPEAPAWTHEARRSVNGLRYRASQKLGTAYQIAGTADLVLGQLRGTACVFVPFTPEFLIVATSDPSLPMDSPFHAQAQYANQVSSRVDVKSVIASGRLGERPLIQRAAPASFFSDLFERRSAADGPQLREPDGNSAVCFPGELITVAFENHGKTPVDIRFVIKGQAFHDAAEKP